MVGTLIQDLTVLVIVLSRKIQCLLFTYREVSLFRIINFNKCPTRLIIVFSCRSPQLLPIPRSVSGHLPAGRPQHSLRGLMGIRGIHFVYLTLADGIKMFTVLRALAENFPWDLQEGVVTFRPLVWHVSHTRMDFSWQFFPQFKRFFQYADGFKSH